jgi:hypothetical protein
MESTQSPYWRALERRTPTLFLVGSGLLVGHAVIRGLRAFTDVSAPPDAFGPAGFFLVFVGLFGLYPALADRAPWLAMAGALLAAVPAIDYALILLFGFGEMAGVTPRLLDIAPDAIFLPIHQGSIILAYGVSGLAVLRTDAYPRSVGVLLLALPALMLAMAVSIALVPNGAAVGFFGGCGMVVIHFALGYSLGGERTLADRLSLTGEGTTG